MLHDLTPCNDTTGASTAAPAGVRQTVQVSNVQRGTGARRGFAGARSDAGEVGLDSRYYEIAL
jgi:hypothetical protein